MIRQGQAIEFEGKEGVVWEVIGPNARVKFSDGTYGFYSVEQLDNNTIENTNSDSRLKSCPFCKSNDVRPVNSQEDDGKIERTLQCMKCSQRYSSEVTKLGVSCFN